MKIHPLAEKLPMMTTDEFEALKESIKKDGLLVPIIVTHDNILIDGRNRLRACIEVGIPPRFITVTDFLRDYEQHADKYLFDVWNRKDGLNKALNEGDNEKITEAIIVMLNVNRRQLNDWQQYVRLSSVTSFVENGSNQYDTKESGSALSADPLTHNQVVTIAEAAEQLGISKRYLHMMKAIDKKAPEEVKQSLNDGKLSINQAYNEVKQSIEDRTKPKEKTPDFFDEHIEDEIDREIARDILNVINKVEKKYGMVYFESIIKYSKILTNHNYKTLWNQLN